MKLDDAKELLTELLRAQFSGYPIADLCKRVLEAMTETETKPDIRREP
jgi:hypothetical protein